MSSHSNEPAEPSRAAADDLQAQSQVEMFNEHDTPPPTLVMQGSCILEMRMANDEFDPPQADPSHPHRKKYKVQYLNNIFMAHVKIVDGSGEMLFRYDNNRDDSNPPDMALTISVGLEDGRSFTISAVGANTEIGIDADVSFRKNVGDVSMNPDERKRLRYRDASNQEQKISNIQVMDRDGLVYQLALNKLKKDGKETKVMIWWEVL